MKKMKKINNVPLTSFLKSKIKKEKSNFLFFRFLLILTTFLLLTTEGIIAQSFDLSRANGKIVARGTNETLVEGDGFKVQSYRIETIPLPESPKSELKDEKQKTGKTVVVRLVITGKFSSAIYAIWINGVPSPAYIGVDGNLQLIRAGPEKMFEENSEISISRGEIESKKVFLPEPFKVPSNLQRPARSKEELKRKVSLSYIGCDGSIFAPNKDCVQIVIRNPFPEENRASNHGWYLQIGDMEFAGAADSFIISAKQFAELKDNEWIVLKTATGIYGGSLVGILDKNSLLGK